MKRIYWILVSFVMIIQLTGCSSSQTVSLEAGSTPTAQSANELSLEVQPESVAESSQSVVLSSYSAVLSAISTEPPTSSEVSVSTSLSEEMKMNHVTIEAGGKTFSATLVDSPAARAFAAYLPMTVQMSEMSGQEKFYGLPDDLPADSTERPSTIHSGDIFCWSGNTLVLFYTTFQNSYGGYVRLGTVDDPEGLAAALGSGSVEVTWSIAQ